MQQQSSLDLKLKELELARKKLELIECVPHLYKFKLYPWQHEFINTWEKVMLLNAGNQLGKSVSQITKCYKLMTEPELWPKLFPEKAHDSTWRPTIWYLYPDYGTATHEFKEKWEKEVLAKGDYKTVGKYSWQERIDRDVIKHITALETGVTVYFKAYSQSATDIQAGSCDAVFCDEELVESRMSEVMARLFGSNGYFSMVFTATLGQDIWRRAMEPKRGEEEYLPKAWKRQVSVYDSQYYTDGTPSRWTQERINDNIAKCKSPNEVAKRIMGKFVKDDGLMYHAFNRQRHYVPFPTGANGVPYFGVPTGWDVISGVDIGTGGSGHPASYAFIAINKDRTKLRMFKGRRLDDVGNTTAGDVYGHYVEARGAIRPIIQVYDHAAKDFFTIAERAGDYFTKANKAKDAGIDIINDLFKRDMLKIYACKEHDKLVEELETASTEGFKNNAKDDFIDAMKYAIVSAPIDWASIFKKDITDTKEEIIYSNERERIAYEYTKRHEKEEANSFNDAYREEYEFWSDAHSFGDDTYN